MIKPDSKIYVAGHAGMVGSALVRELQRAGYTNVLARTRTELDLQDQRQVFEFLRAERPEFIFIAAAKVGGIHANNHYRAEFIYQNLAIAANLIHGAHLADIQNLIFLGSSCVYPRDCPQPIREEYLLTGPLEFTNEPYAIAKIAGIKLCESYRQQYGRAYGTVMPTNLYGPNDNYDLNTSHVLPALLRKAYEARLRNDPEMVVWGSGNPRREFLYVDDLANACVMLMEQQMRDADRPEFPSLVNIGCGEDLTIRELAHTIAEVAGFSGELRFDPSRPDGTPRKLLDIQRITSLGWKPKTSLREGLRLTLEDYLQRAPGA
jgi:GDP-L-fucose synthase